MAKTVYTINLTFTNLQPQSIVVDFAETRDLEWEISDRSGISITPTTYNTNGSFQFSSLSIFATRITVVSNTIGFRIQLSAGTSGEILIGSVNLMAGQLEVAIPVLSQSTIVVAGEHAFTLPLINNN
jgi:hypothetical protein